MSQVEAFRLLKSLRLLEPDFSELSEEVEDEEEVVEIEGLVEWVGRTSRNVCDLDCRTGRGGGPDLE